MAVVLQKSQLRARVNAVVSRHREARVIGFTTPAAWAGGDELDCGEVRFRVRVCPSVLSLRAALLEAEQAAARLVVLTPLVDVDLEEDVKARLTGRRLRETDAWTSVKQLFQAAEVDPALRQQRWLVDVLLERVPADGYLPVPGRALTAAHVWRVVLEQLLGLTEACPDSRVLLAWATTTAGPQAYRALPDDQRQAIRQWLEGSAGGLGALLLAAVEAGHGEDVLALGLACEVVFADADERTLRDAAVRLERFTGGAAVRPELAEQWRDDALGLLAADQEAPQGERARPVLARLDDLLTQLGIADQAWRSSASPRGFEQMLAKVGETVAAGLEDAAALGGARAWLDRLAQHGLAKSWSSRRSQAHMAVRLACWLQGVPEPTADADLPELARRYAADGAFVDWARTVLHTGDNCAALAQASAAVLKAADARRAAENEAFARKLAAWTAADGHGPGLLRIEDVLADVVAPLAKQLPALVLVLDGMSCAVFRELLADCVQRRHWVQWHRSGTVVPLPVLAALPSTTEASRRSLWYGRLTADALADEAKGFAEHPALRPVSGKHPPVLFGKADLRGTSGDPASDVKAAIVDPRRRVVGLIINAVDDSLTSGEQIRSDWRVEQVPALEQALGAARDAGRVVVLLSDHGHVLDRGSGCREYEGHERYREAVGEPGAGELVVTGPRVLLPAAGRMIAAWAEDLRYQKHKKNGYHGGLSPQEMVVPLAVLTAGDDLTGWHEGALYEPAWWSLSPGAVPVRLPVTPAGQECQSLPLFAASSGDWVAGLLHSPTLRRQRQLAGRLRLDDERITAFCRALAVAGGSLLGPALARAMDLPMLRLHGLVSGMQRLLNVDGYGVVSFDRESDTVRLDVELLKRQFELEA